MAPKSTKPNSAQRMEVTEPATEKDVHVTVFEGHKASIWCVAMPADGSFAITSGDDGTVRRWELEAGNNTSQVICSDNTYRGVAVTGDGRLAAAAAGDGTIQLVDLVTNTTIKHWKAHKNRVGNLAFLADGRELLSVSEDGYIRRWNTNTAKCVAQCKLPFKNLYGVAASADGNLIVGSAWLEGLAVWSGRDGEKASIFRESVSNMSPLGMPADGRFAFTATSDGKVAQWNISVGRRTAGFEGHHGEVNSLAITPDGRFCVSAGTDNRVHLWAAETGQCLAVLSKHVSSIYGVAITPDGQRIATAGKDLTLHIWDIPETILARAKTSQKRGYVNAKVVLLGDSGVGKSGLALRLWHNRWEKTESSHGMEIQRLSLPPTGIIDGVEREVWLWDLAGQPDYRLTHQLFMEQTSMALLVFDPQESNIFETVGYWQEALSKVARATNVAGILVAARCDRPGLRLTLEEVNVWAQRRGLSGPILTAAKQERHPGVSELRDLIAKLLPWDKMEFRSTMDNFPTLKDAILAVRDAKGIGGIVVKPTELEARVRKAARNLDFTSEDLLAVTGLLAGEGVLHALPYGDLVVLQPSWVNCYASTLVKMAGEHDSRLGHVALATIQPGKLPCDDTPRLPLEDEKLLLPALVALFLERALAWKQDTDKGPMLVFPNYVRLPRPSPPPRPGRTVLYRISGPLEEIYCTLVVRLHYSGLFFDTKLYRQAVDFHTATGELAALTMKEQGERGELEIYFGKNLAPALQASFQQFVHDHLEGKATNLERLRNYHCPKCGFEARDRDALDALIAKNVKKVPCQYCFMTKKGIIVLNDVLETQLASKEGEEGADKADRKAREEITAAAKEQEMVGEVMALVATANQIYRIEAEPDEGVDGQIEFRDSNGRATGLTYRVQLKSGNSHLRQLKDGTEVFILKKHYEHHWARKGSVPVLLIVRTSDGRTRYINATKTIRAAQKAKSGKPLKQINFVGKFFTKDAIIRMRNERLK